MDIFDYQDKYIGHDVEIELKNGKIMHEYIIDIDFADDNDLGKDMIIYQVDIGSGGNVAGEGIPIDSIKKIKIIDD